MPSCRVWGDMSGSSESGEEARKRGSCTINRFPFFEKRGTGLSSINSVGYNTHIKPVLANFSRHRELGTSFGNRFQCLGDELRKETERASLETKDSVMRWEARYYGPSPESWSGPSATLSPSTGRRKRECAGTPERAGQAHTAQAWLPSGSTGKGSVDLLGAGRGTGGPSGLPNGPRPAVTFQDLGARLGASQKLKCTQTL